MGYYVGGWEGVSGLGPLGNVYHHYLEGSDLAVYSEWAVAAAEGKLLSMGPWAWTEFSQLWVFHDRAVLATEMFHVVGAYVSVLKKQGYQH